MAEPPISPPSSDIAGTDRDRGKLLARRKSPLANQQAQLKRVADQDVARPPADSHIKPRGNSQ